MGTNNNKLAESGEGSQHGHALISASDLYKYRGGSLPAASLPSLPSLFPPTALLSSHCHVIWGIFGGGT